MKLSSFINTTLFLAHELEKMGARRVATSTLLVALRVAEAHKAKTPVIKTQLMKELDLFYTSVQTGIGVLVKTGIATERTGDDNKKLFVELTPKGEEFFDRIFDGKSSTENERPDLSGGLVSQASIRNKKAPALPKEVKEKPVAPVKEVKEKPTTPAKAPAKKAPAKKPVAFGAPKVPSAKKAPAKPAVTKKAPAKAPAKVPAPVKTEKKGEGLLDAKIDEATASTGDTKPAVSPAVAALLDKTKPAAPAKAPVVKKKLSFGK